MKNLTDTIRIDTWMQAGNQVRRQVHQEALHQVWDQTESLIWHDLIGWVKMPIRHLVLNKTG